MIPAEAKPSVTAELVKFKLEGTPPKHFPWTDHEPLGFSGERGLVIAIQTPRAGSSGAGGQTASTLRAGETWVYSPGDGAPFYSDPFEWLGLTRRVRPYIQFVKKHLVWPIVRPLERIPIRRFHGLMEKIREKIGPEYHVRVTPGPEVVKRLKAEVRQVRDLCATLDRFNADLRKPKVAKKIQKRLENIEGKKAPGFDDHETQWLLRLSRIREGAAVGRLGAASCLCPVGIERSVLSFLCTSWRRRRADRAVAYFVDDTVTHHNHPRGCLSIASLGIAQAG